VELTTQQFDNYSWNTNNQTQSITIAVSGNYEVTVTDENNCTNTAAFEANTIDIAASIGQLPPTCNGNGTDGQIQFSNSSGGMSPYIYSINGGDSFETTTDFQNILPGTYSTVVEDSDGCQWESNIAVLESTNLTIDAGDDRELDLGDSARLQVLINLTNYDSISWTPAASLSCFDCESPIAKPMETTKYFVKVMANDGCIAEDALMIYVKKPERIYLPNVFSPNNDGENDHFFPIAGEDVQQIKTFRIFDRYGGLVFERSDFLPNNPTLGWDGLVKGIPANDGVFVWMTEVEFVNGQIEVKQGDVMILK